MKRHIIYLFGVVLLLLPACTTHVDSLEWALRQAGKNRAELEKVLQHYESDSLKLAAATFLIRKMPYHIGFCDTLFTPDGKTLHFLTDTFYVDKSGVMKGPDIKGCATRTVGKKNE